MADAVLNLYEDDYSIEDIMAERFLGWDEVIELKENVFIVKWHMRNKVQKIKDVDTAGFFRYNQCSKAAGAGAFFTSIRFMGVFDKWVLQTGV